MSSCHWARHLVAWRGLHENWHWNIGRTLNRNDLMQLQLTKYIVRGDETWWWANWTKIISTGTPSSSLKAPTGRLIQRPDFQERIIVVARMFIQWAKLSWFKYTRQSKPYRSTLRQLCTLSSIGYWLKRIAMCYGYFLTTTCLRFA